MYEIVYVPVEDKRMLVLVEEPEKRGTPRGPVRC